MAWLLLYTGWDYAGNQDEFVVITDLEQEQWDDEFEEPNYELAVRVEIQGDVTSFPTDRALRQER